MSTRISFPRDLPSTVHHVPEQPRLFTRHLQAVQSSTDRRGQVAIPKAESFLSQAERSFYGVLDASTGISGQFVLCAHRYTTDDGMDSKTVGC
jgi:hypothetical protein